MIDKQTNQRLRMFQRYFISVLIIWSLVIGVSFAWNFFQINEQTKNLALNESLANFNKDQGFRNWGTKHGGVYVPISDATPPSPYLSHIPERDISTPSGKRLTLLNPAYMVRQLMEDYAKEYGVKGKITGLILLRPENAPDEWEEQALRKLKAGAPEIVNFTEIDGAPFLRIMRPMMMTPGCDKCHGHLGFKTGDFRGGVSVSIPMVPYYRAQQLSMATLVGTHSLIWFLGIGLISFGARRIKASIIENQTLYAVLEDRIKERTSELAKSETFLREAQSIAHFGCWYRNPKAGEYNWSDEEYKIFGLDPDGPEVTYEDFINIVHPEDRQFVLAAHKAYDFNLEYRIIRPNGEIRYIQSHGAVHRDANGEVESMLGAVNDITDQKQIENDLRKLSSAVEQSPNAVFITDTEGTIEYVNSSFTKLTGYKPDEAFGQNPRILKSNETPKELFADLWSTIQAGKEWRGEIKDRGKDGKEFWAHEMIAPVKDEHGKITHYVATHEDITQRKEDEIAVLSALEDADIANRAKSELLANMSHELRTPLNAIIGFSDSIKQETFGPLNNEKYQEYINDISDSGQHLLDLINDILDVSAIEARKLELYEEAIEIVELIKASVRLIEHRAESGKILLNINIESNLPKLYADKRRLKQILLNLLANAVKFTPSGGSVTLQASLEDDYSINFSIADTGIGMNKIELTKAMTQFGQVDREKATQHEGAGLGLPLTRGLVELHDGSLEITSEKNVGTTVVVRFPKERIVNVSQHFKES